MSTKWDKKPTNLEILLEINKVMKDFDYKDRQQLGNYVTLLSLEEILKHVKAIKERKLT